MKLLIDIGNSRLKWCTYDAGARLSDLSAIEHGNHLDSRTLDSVWQMLPMPQAVYMLTVASMEVESIVCEWVKARWQLDITKLRTQAKCSGVSNGYVQVEQLGVDRWAAIIAGYQLTKTATCIIDSGTALTCDAVDAEGQHLGGWITPGRNLQRECLLHGTSGVAIESDAESTGIWGRDTVSCVEAGLIHSQAALIERAIGQMEHEWGQEVAVVITGGDGEALLSRLASEALYVPNLVFQGMTHMLRERGV